MMNNTREEQPRKGLFLAGAMNCLGEFNRLCLSSLREIWISSCPKSPPPTLWQLALFIEGGPGPLPKN